MANYESYARTNYFHVKNPDAFRTFMDTVNDIDELWDDETDNNGTQLFGFSAFAFPTVGDDFDEDAFIEEFQSHLVENDACIFTEVGHENLRYLVGHVTVITATDMQGFNLEDRAIQIARELLKDENWVTKNEY